MRVFYACHSKRQVALLAAAQVDKRRRWDANTPEDSDAFFKAKPWNFCRMLDYARDNESIIYVPMIYAGQ